MEHTIEKESLGLGEPALGRGVQSREACQACQLDRSRRAPERMQLGPGEGVILQMDSERGGQEILQPPNVRVPTFLIGVGESRDVSKAMPFFNEDG